MDLLNCSVKLVKIRDLLDSLQVQITILLELLLMSLNQVLHGSSHDTQIYFLANQRAFQHLAGHVKVERVGASNGCLQLAIGAFLSTVLHLTLVTLNNSRMNSEFTYVGEHIGTERETKSKEGSVRIHLAQPVDSLAAS